jgi:protein TonB
MLTSKFDLYKTEWLDLVFENRNKNYGAYYLRRHYADNMVRAMGITFLSLLLLCGATVFFKSHPAPVIIPPNDHVVQVKLSEIHIAEPKKPAAQPKATVPVKTTAFVPFVVTPDPQVHNPPPVTIDIKGEVGQTTNTKGTEVNTGPIETKTEGTGTQPAIDNEVHTIGGLEFMPQPIGGESAWAKFLNKNLRYPIPAQEDGVSGRVILSFIIEKDGSLSNIVVQSPAGHGFDEEALRVLKLAKAWKPGMQNGQPVRVRYAIPINFRLSSE